LNLEEDAERHKKFILKYNSPEIKKTKFGGVTPLINTTEIKP
jgi:hypothetical protein